jgi:hypothetical protein
MKKQIKNEKQMENVSHLVKVLQMCISTNYDELQRLKVILESKITDIKEYEFALHEYAYVEGCNGAYQNVLDSIADLHRNEILNKSFNYN